ncbi:hypothetical protein PVT68_12180 [Microbulbifer bruguierae]|uniref:EamA domain-containing protein n=1 Tax=Microbulbifer bruguierae TaxID=3029061 RepID=A0ABY8NCP8_9GAMM|nr:hypothetical protein [Microbulbifer bruguierae]WGL15527.1 hypothetical protein PVT68_12180 [Microbulbifer bruguierae]
MQPVVAVSLIFTLVLGAVLWIYLLRLAFAESTLLGITAIAIPPLALLIILAQRPQDGELIALTVAVITFAGAVLTLS